MTDLKRFLINMQKQFEELDSLSKKILKEERSIHNKALIKKGFIIHYYSINYNAINTSILSKLLIELKKILRIEVKLQEDLESRSEDLNELAKLYNSVPGNDKLDTVLLKKNLKQALYYCNLMVTRIKQLEVILEGGVKLHKKDLPEKTEIFFRSFENVGSKILRFISILEQFTKKVLNFEKNAFYTEPRTYGRVMAPSEFKKTLKDKKLSSMKNLTPVFDAPRTVVNNVKSMSKDKMKNFFGQIGVVGGVKVIFFETRLKPINHDKPIPQSNGLREYKFQKGTRIEILDAA